MDASFRHLQRQCLRGDSLACLGAFAHYKRGGIAPENVLPQILYLGTEHALENQDPVDFRDLLNEVQVTADSGFRLFRSISFNHNYWISIQASRTHYCTPRETLSNIYGYQAWEVMFGYLPRQIKIIYFEDEEQQAIANGTPVEDLESFKEALRDYLDDPDITIEYAWTDEDRDEIRVRVHCSKFDPGGVLYGFPHQDIFSVYDTVASRVPTEDVQNIVDFLRARFGLQNQI